MEEKYQSFARRATYRVFEVSKMEKYQSFGSNMIY
jgi:hypothetical protein